MLVEALVYALSVPGTPVAFRSYLPEAVGLWARGRRQRVAWAPHQEATRAVLTAGAGAAPRGGTVAVLGSGPLFDLPLEALARSFGSVALIDRAHLAIVRGAVRPYSNVKLLWRDLSPLASRDVLGFLEQLPALDWVISLNLLSQLADAVPAKSRRDVVESHLEQLRRLPCRVTLVSDIAYRVLDRAGAVLEQVDMLGGSTMPAPDCSWSWEVAPFGEEEFGRRRVHTVCAWQDWRQSGGGPNSVFIPPDDASKLRPDDPVAQQDRAQDS